MAKIHFKYGAMNSGKSSVLLNVAYNYQEHGLDIIVIKPSVDTKGGQNIITRSGNKLAIDIAAAPDTNLRQAIKLFASKNKFQKLSCILIDEAQFLTANQVDQLYEVAKFDNISVIAYGLRADFRSKLFSGSKRLFEIVDNIEKILTICRCGNQAEFNCRMDNGKYVFDGSQIAIDGKGTTTYNSLCGICYTKAKKANQPKPQHSKMTDRRILKKDSKGI